MSVIKGPVGSYLTTSSAKRRSRSQRVRKRRMRKGKRVLSRRMSFTKHAKKARGKQFKSKSRRRPRSKSRKSRKSRSRSKRSKLRSRRGKKSTTAPNRSSWFLGGLWGRSSGKRQRNKSGHRDNRSGLYSSIREPQHMKDVKFNRFIHKLRRQGRSKGCSIDQHTMSLMDSMLKNFMHGIALKASSKMGRRKVLNHKILLRGMRNLMPRHIRERAHEKGRIALDRFMSGRRKLRRPRLGHGGHHGRTF